MGKKKQNTISLAETQRTQRKAKTGAYKFAKIET